MKENFFFSLSLFLDFVTRSKVMLLEGTKRFFFSLKTSVVVVAVLMVRFY